MKLCAETEADFFRGHAGIPDSWTNVMGATASPHDIRRTLVCRIRRIGPDSDRLLSVILDDRANAELACQAVAVALMPLMHRRCRLHPQAVDDLLVELCAVVGRAIRDGLPETHRHLVNVLLDKAWGAHRAGRRRPPTVPIDPEVVAALQPPTRGVEDAVLDRLALREYRDSLAADSVGNRPIVRSWNSALELASRDRRTIPEQNRWKYVRRQLRAHASADILA